MHIHMYVYIYIYIHMHSIAKLNDSTLMYIVAKCVY